MTIKKDLEMYSVNPLHLIFNKVSGYFESKEKIKKYGELWSNISIYGVENYGVFYGELSEV